MTDTPSPLNPEDIDDLLDHLATMIITGPTFVDPDFPHLTPEIVFAELEQGIEYVRSEIGESSYHMLLKLSASAKLHYSADISDKGADAVKAREALHEMELILLDALER